MIAVIALGVVLLGGRNKETQTTPINSTQVPIQNQQPPQTVTVTVDSSGFSPATLTIKAGTRVQWDNNSGGEISINSDEHPTHSLYPELNDLNIVTNDSNVSLVFDKPGTYTYHDHYNPSRTGTVVVE